MIEPGGLGAAHRMMVRQGFLLFLLSLLSGVLTPFLASGRMGVGAHVIGLLGAMVLIIVGLAAPLLRLSPALWRAMHVAWLTTAYGNWSAATLAALTGASRLTPIAGAGSSGPAVAEAVVAIMFAVVSVAALVGAAIAIYGLRPMSGR